MILGFWTLSVILGDGAWGSTSLPWESCLIWWSWASSCNWCPCLLGTVAGVGHRVGNIFLGQLPKKRVSKEKLGLYRGSNWQSGYEGLNHAKMSNPKQQVQLIQLPKTIPWYKANNSPGNLQVYVISDPVLYALNLQSHSAGDHWRHQQPPGRVAETRRSGSHEVTGGW